MNILITGVWRGYDESIEERLKSMGHEIEYIKWDKDAAGIDPLWPEMIVTGWMFDYVDICEFKNLKFIQLSSAGLDRITSCQWEYIRENDIALYNASGIYSLPMAEYALGAALMIYRGFDIYEKKKLTGDRSWNKPAFLRELSGSRVLIIGCGSVGRECAIKFKTMGCKVYGINRSPKEDDAFIDILGMECLDSEISKADIIILSVAYTEETRHLLNERRLLSLNENQLVINIARGGIIDTSKISLSKAEFVLDVFEEEPLLEESFLWDLSNVHISPHNSYRGNGNNDRLTSLILNNISEFISK